MFNNIKLLVIIVLVYKFLSPELSAYYSEIEEQPGIGLETDNFVSNSISEKKQNSTSIQSFLENIITNSDKNVLNEDNNFENVDEQYNRPEIDEAQQQSQIAELDVKVKIPNEEYLVYIKNLGEFLLTDENSQKVAEQPEVFNLNLDDHLHSEVISKVLKPKFLQELQTGDKFMNSLMP